MLDVANKRVLVVGLDTCGWAACEFLSRHGAKVTGVDSSDTQDLRERAARLRSLGVEVALGVPEPPQHGFSLAVLNPTAATNSKLVDAVRQGSLPHISELDLGVQESKCLTIAIAGTNGKSTTSDLIERILTYNHRKAMLAGGLNRPVCSVVDETKELDFLILRLNACQLELTEQVRPSVAVLLNVSPSEHEGKTAEDYVRANARLFRNQEVFDWAIIQFETLEMMRRLGLPVPAKTITFSAREKEADLYLDRGVLRSRLPGWAGLLLDLHHCQLQGPHNAENFMAALAVGHALRLPLDAMVDSLKTYGGLPHRFQLVAEINGVRFINDAKAGNVGAVRNALLAAGAQAGGEPNVWLIAGGDEESGDFHDLGPALSRAVKRAFLLGAAGKKIRAAWSLFTPCTMSRSLIEAISDAAKDAASGDVVLLSPACSSLEEFRDYQHLGEAYCQAVKSIGRGAPMGNPNMNGKSD
jgi:UDP-N-acetylmuramoylalanine--D-glutamate ligase